MNNFESNTDNKPNFLTVAPEEIIVDEQIKLRTLQMVEAEKVFKTVDINREELKKWLPWVDSTVSSDNSKKFIEEVRSKRDSAEEAPYGIFFKDEFAGHISLMARDNQAGEIGYWLDKRVYGKGLATKAANCLTQLGFSKLGCRSIVILAEEGNDASQAVARRLNFDELGVVQKDGRNLLKFELKYR